MKTAIRWTVLAILLCSIPAFAEGPRNRERLADKPHFVDGVAIDFSELGQFNQQEMFWVVEKEAVYGFTTPEAVKEFGKESAAAKKPGLKQIVANDLSGCSAFNKNVGCGGADWKILCPPSQEAHLSDSWNDVISCVDAGSNVGKYTVVYKCYYFSASAGDCYAHIQWISPGTLITDLNAYSMNNIISSIRFCNNIDPYSCS